MNKSIRILVCGMPRSMTTWIFNVVKEQLSAYQAKTMWIEPNDHKSEHAFSDSDGICIAKCHHYSKALAESADLIIYSYRDIRTAAVSYHRKFNSEYSHGYIASWIDAQKAWMKYADISLQYEGVVNDEENALIKIAEVIKQKKPELKLHEDSQAVHQQVEKSFQSKQTTDEINYSTDSMILPGHRTFQPEPENLAGVDKQIYDQVQTEFSTWLHQYGYIDTDDYGQEIEFDIAAKFLSCFTEPYVIDIGVERGSFIDLAVKSGAGKVDGFEPLPRHLDYLHKKYGTTGLVSINLYAVSDKSGEAEFHVATDSAGNELDYHHTLSDLGDSATVIRSKNIIKVKTTTLNDFFKLSSETVQIDFLKVDTDGHDLSVLHGLGELRPTIIMAEYWDDLPETSGTSSYRLSDLMAWAKENGYSESVIVRRNGQMELIESNTPWSVSGDWGNVFFIRSTFNFNEIKSFIDDLSKCAYRSVCANTARMKVELEQKEAVIQGLAASLEEKEYIIQTQIGSLEEKELALQAQIVSIEQNEKKYRVFNTIARIPGFWVLASLASRSVTIFRPRLGWLNQYSARPLKVNILSKNNSKLSNYPVIAVVTPSFNQADFIERTIKSVLDQHYPNLEYFVQDGGSDDDTVDVLKNYENEVSGWRSEADSGQSQAINRGFTHTSGEIMAWLNSDDLFLPDTLHIVAEYFNQHPDIDVVYGNRLMIDENDMEIGRWILPGHNGKVMAWADYIPQETMFWRRSIWDKVGGEIDESFRFAMDWDLIMRFRQAGAKFAHIPRFLGAFRIHEQQKTSSVINELGMEEMNRIRIREHGYLPDRHEVRKKTIPFLIRHIVTDFSYRIKVRLGFKVS